MKHRIISLMQITYGIVYFMIAFIGLMSHDLVMVGILVVLMAIDLIRWTVLGESLTDFVMSGNRLKNSTD